MMRAYLFLEAGKPRGLEVGPIWARNKRDAIRKYRAGESIKRLRPGTRIWRDEALEERARNWEDQAGELPERKEEWT
jgi:hypothetical protein